MTKKKLNLLRTPMDELLVDDDPPERVVVNESFADKLKAADAAILELLARIDVLQRQVDAYRDEYGWSALQDDNLFRLAMDAAEYNARYYMEHGGDTSDPVHMARMGAECAWGPLCDVAAKWPANKENLERIALLEEANEGAHAVIQATEAQRDRLAHLLCKVLTSSGRLAVYDTDLTDDEIRLVKRIHAGEWETH